MTWVLYKQFRFDWGPAQNGYALFFVGAVSAIVQGGLQGHLIKAFGEERLVVAGMASAMLAFLCYGLITEGWMMYVVISANFLAVAAGPAMQAIVSKSVGASQQGITQGSLAAISSVAIIFAPLVGTSILATVSHLPATDWRMGATFFLCAALQGTALILAVWHFLRLKATGAS